MTAGTELCNGLDDDCNGTIDDSCSCPEMMGLGAGKYAICLQPDGRVYYLTGTLTQGGGSPDADVAAGLWEIQVHLDFAAPWEIPLSMKLLKAGIAYVDLPNSLLIGLCPQVSVDGQARHHPYRLSAPKLVGSLTYSGDLLTMPSQGSPGLLADLPDHLATFPPDYIVAGVQRTAANVFLPAGADAYGDMTGGKTQCQP